MKWHLIKYQITAWMQDVLETLINKIFCLKGQKTYRQLRQESKEFYKLIKIMTKNEQRNKI